MKNNQVESEKLIKLATYASVLTAALIIIAKIIGLLATDSLTILASLMDSCLDIVASIINLVAVRYALIPPDDEHRFGHGKAEDLAVFSQSLFFGLSGFYVAFMAIKRIFYQESLQQEFLGMGLMFFSVILTFALVTFQKYVMKRTRSNVIEADHFHYVVDLLTNSGAILALFIAHYTKIKVVDPLVAVGIAAYIIYGSYRLFIKAVNNLMDREFSVEEKKLIIMAIQKSDRVKGFHDLKTRYSGVKPIIQFHLELDGKMNLFQAHEITSAVKKEVLKVMPIADVTVHQDPEGVEEEVEYKDDI